MNILYISYSCDPYNGSEDKIGWNIPLESSKINNVYVITKEEHRTVINNYMNNNPNKNLYFYFVDIPNFYKKIFKGFMYSGRLNIWHKKAYTVAQNICKQNQIDIIHQIAPVEFRAIGDYGKIKNIKFFCGPLGGGEYIPKALIGYAKKHFNIEIIRWAMNLWSCIIYKFTKKLNNCERILFANKETMDYVCRNINIKSNIVDMKPLPEISVSNSEIGYLCNEYSKRNNDSCVFLVMGRLIYRKGHEFLFDALKKIPKEYNYQCRVVGSGKELNNLVSLCKNSSIKDKVIFIENIPFSKVETEYAKADVLIMPSIRETTGSVILEAFSKGMPVITINKFGGSNLVDNNTGWLYDGSSKEEYVDNLSKIIIECISNPDEIKCKGNKAIEKAKEYTWENRCAMYQRMYNKSTKE